MEELLKDKANDAVKETVKRVTEGEKGKDITHEQLAGSINEALANPSGAFAARLAEKVMADYRP